MKNQFDISTDTTGFSSPAENYVDKRLDPKDLIVTNPLSTFFMSACGNMEDISDGDILVIDRSINPKQGDKVVILKSGRLELKNYSEQSDVWGVLTFSIRRHRK